MSAPDSPIQAVLWDNDGVLVDTEAIFYEVTSAAFASAGLELTHDFWARNYLGAGKPSYQLAIEFGLPPARAQQLIDERNARFQRHLEGPVPIRPGIHDVLRQLRGRVRMGLVTGSSADNLQRMHRRTGLLSEFECIVTSEDAPHSKPHPGLYLTALERMGLQPQNCLAVEDSPRGVSAARAANIPCVLIPTSLTALDLCPHASHICRHPRELPALCGLS